MNFLPENDGIDHINIYSQGRTALGRWLSNFTYAPIDIPGDGRFISIEGYWYWLGCGDDRLRHLSGYNAKKLGRQILKTKFKFEQREDFQNLIRKSLDLKLKSNLEKLTLFYKSSLPFDHYYVYGGDKYPAGYEWIVQHFEDRRRLLRHHYGII